MRIKQRHEESHYETIISKSISGGYEPIAIGYGITQDEADTKALKKLEKKAMKKYNIELSSPRLNDAKLLASLRKYVITFGRMPTTRELRATNNLASYDAFVNHFGSWNKVKMMAGLDQLLEEMKHEKTLV